MIIAFLHGNNLTYPNIWMRSMGSNKSNGAKTDVV